MIETVLGIAVLIISLFVPGYFVGLAFFPKRESLDSVERTTLSFVLSLTFLPLLVLIGNIVFSIAINEFSVWGSFALLVVFGLFSYLARTGSIPVPGPFLPLFPQVPKSEAIPLIPLQKKQN